MKLFSLFYAFVAASFVAGAVPSLSNTATFVLSEKGVGSRPVVLFGDKAVLNQLVFRGSPSCSMVYIVQRSSEGGWRDLLKPFTISPQNVDPLPLPTSISPTASGSSFDACVSSIIDCWLKETDTELLYVHTQRIALGESSELLEKYAVSIGNQSFIDPFKKMCAARILTKANPKRAIQLCFESMAAHKTGIPNESAMFDDFRDQVLLMLGTATDASNFEQHWSYLLGAPDGVKAIMLKELTGNPFHRKSKPLAPKQFLGVHRAAIMDMLQSTNIDLSFEAYIAICMADGTFQNVYRSSKEFAKHREDVVKALIR